MGVPNSFREHRQGIVAKGIQHSRILDGAVNGHDRIVEIFHCVPHWFRSEEVGCGAGFVEVQRGLGRRLDLLGGRLTVHFEMVQRRILRGASQPDHIRVCGQSAIAEPPPTLASGTK
jgi:hypothetical protein